MSRTFTFTEKELDRQAEISSALSYLHGYDPNKGWPVRYTFVPTELGDCVSVTYVVKIDGKQVELTFDITDMDSW